MICKLLSWLTNCVKINQGFRLPNGSSNKLLIASSPDNRRFCRFKNEICLITIDFDKRAEELGQHYTEKEVNPEEIDQFLDENDLFK